MIEKIYKTSNGPIHYWVNKEVDIRKPALVF